jgi:hypothetical protein
MASPKGGSSARISSGTWATVTASILKALKVSSRQRASPRALMTVDDASSAYRSITPLDRRWRSSAGGRRPGLPGGPLSHEPAEAAQPTQAEATPAGTPLAAR